jgi:four helix bundle protein
VSNRFASNGATPSLHCALWNELANVQLSTLNVQHSTTKGEVAVARHDFDLEDRLLDYSAAVIDLVDQLPNSRSGNHVSGQLLRSGTSPLPNHGEAQAAESTNDFIHKMRVCLKELRESRRWFRLIKRSPRLKCRTDPSPLIAETEELIKIFFSSIRTAMQQKKTKVPPMKRGDRSFGARALTA